VVVDILNPDRLRPAAGCSRSPATSLANRRPAQSLTSAQCDHNVAKFLKEVQWQELP
jgi:hypothetical protein